MEIIDTTKEVDSQTLTRVSSPFMKRVYLLTSKRVGVQKVENEFIHELTNLGVAACTDFTLSQVLLTRNIIDTMFTQPIFNPSVVEIEIVDIIEQEILMTVEPQQLFSAVTVVEKNKNVECRGWFGNWVGC